MKKIFTLSAALIVAAALLSACTSLRRSQPGGSPQFINTAPADFRIAGDTTGEACVTAVFGVYWSRLFTAESGVSGTYGAFDTAEAQAVYNALAKVEDSSYFMLGQKKSTFSGFFPIYWESCSTVHGRAVTVISTK